MKTKYIILILISLLLGSCIKKEQVLTLPPPVSTPFKPALELAVRELIDSLKNEIGEEDLLSIVFHFHPYANTNYHNRFGIEFFILEGYASNNIDGYAKIDSTTIAIYNLKEDLFELVNKNEITFYTDTIFGFNDLCFFDTTGKKPISYAVASKDSITKVSYSMDFPHFAPLRIKPECLADISFTPPEEYQFYIDSLDAEEHLKFYQKEVKYFRNKRPRGK